MTPTVDALAQSAACAAAAAVCTANAWRGAAEMAERFAQNVRGTRFTADPDGALREFASMLRRAADGIAEGLVSRTEGP